METTRRKCHSSFHSYNANHHGCYTNDGDSTYHSYYYKSPTRYYHDYHDY